MRLEFQVFFKKMKTEKEKKKKKKEKDKRILLKPFELKKRGEFKKRDLKGRKGTRVKH